MNLVKVNHVQIDSMNVEKTRRFYESVFGAKIHIIIEKAGKITGYHMKLGSEAIIEIQPPRFGEKSGRRSPWMSICIHTNNVEEKVKKIIAFGGRYFETEDDIYKSINNVNTILVEGLDGEIIELCKN